MLAERCGWSLQVNETFSESSTVCCGERNYSARRSHLEHVHNQVDNINFMWASSRKYAAHVDITQRVLAEKTSEISEDRQLLLETMRLKRLKNYQNGCSLSGSSSLTARGLPKLRLEEISIKHNGWNTSQTSRDEISTHATCSLNSLLTNRPQRQNWLRMTAPLTTENLLTPYSVKAADSSGVRYLSTPERIEEESIVWSESKRISKTLRQINTNRRNLSGKSEPIATRQATRSEILKNISFDLKAVNSKVVSIVASLGVQPPKPRRFDFITANKDHTFLTKMDTRRARAFRQSIEGVQRSESVIHKNILIQSERSEQIYYASISRRGENKSNFRNFDSTVQQMSWLTYAGVACFASRLANRLDVTRRARMGSAILIQRTWRHYVSVSKILATWAVSIISKWVCKIIVRFRLVRKHRAADKIRVFMFETKKNICICQAVPAFLKFKLKVKNLQAAVRLYLESVFALRAKYVAQFDKIEDTLLRGLIRENIRLLEKERGLGDGKTEIKGERDTRAKKGASPPVKGLGSDGKGMASEVAGVSSVRHSKSAQETKYTIDWTSITDLSKFRTTDDLKKVMVAASVRKNRLAFVEKKQAWHLEMKEYKAHFKQTILFRANVDDYLISTGQEHRTNNIENLVDSVSNNNASFKLLMRKMNRKMPQRPVFKEMISDDRMKGLVMECLRLQCEDNSQLRALLAVHRRKLDQVHSSHHEVKANAMDDGYILSRLAEIRNQEAKDQCGPALSQDAGLFTSLQRRHGPQAALRVDGPTAEAATTSEPRHV